MEAAYAIKQEEEAIKSRNASEITVGTNSWKAINNIMWF